jgi:hypothetical protein
MNYQFRLFIALTLVMLSCTPDKLDVDVSAVQFEVEFDRFEQDMFNVKTPQEMYGVYKELKTKGGPLFDFYLNDMLGFKRVSADSLNAYLFAFTQDTLMRDLKNDMDARFQDFESVEAQFIDAFKHLKFHLPNALLPEQVITYNGAFNYGVVSTDTQMGLGLDMYIGPDNRKLKLAGFPVYMTEKMQPQYLIVDAAHSWLVTNIFLADRGENFLEDLIYFGKLRYAIRAMLPEKSRADIMRYSEEEYEFALASEYSIWQYLVSKEWIYTTDMKVKLRFFEPAPTTVGVDGSPGRLGQFIGWQMVEAYMEKHPAVTLKELLEEENNTQILKAYKPKSNE